MINTINGSVSSTIIYRIVETKKLITWSLLFILNICWRRLQNIPVIEPKDCKVLNFHIGGQDIGYRDFLYRMDPADDGLHPKGDFITVTLPADRCFLYESPGRGKGCYLSVWSCTCYRSAWTWMLFSENRNSWKRSSGLQSPCSEGLLPGRICLTFGETGFLPSVLEDILF